MDLGAFCRGLLNLDGIDTSSSAFPGACKAVGVVMIDPPWGSLLAIMFESSVGCEVAPGAAANEKVAPLISSAPDISEG